VTSGNLWERTMAGSMAQETGAVAEALRAMVQDNARRRSQGGAGGDLRRRASHC
jgi:hypothetical protein